MPAWKEIWKWTCQGSYPLLLAAFFLLFIVAPATDSSTTAEPLLDALMATVVLGALYASQRLKNRMVWLVLLAVVATGARVLMHTMDLGRSRVIGDAVHVLFFLVVLVRMLRDVFSAKRVTGDKICGAVAIYLLIGLTAAFIHSLVESLHPGSYLFNGQPLPAMHRLRALVYFSLTTLTTVGYGDMVPVSTVARSYSTMEAIIGQVYLTVLVARLVSLHVIHMGTPPPEGPRD